MNRILVVLMMLVLPAGIVANAQETPPKPAVPRTFGPALTMPLPESIRAEQRDEGVAITRMSVLFGQKRPDSGIELQFEDMRTVAPVVFASFDGKRCDQEIDFITWLGRIGRWVDLTFTVKTTPSKLEGMSVVLEHLHYQGVVATSLFRYSPDDVEIGKPYSVRLQGSRPGVNRYRIHVSYKNAEGKTVEQPGFSHWVVVQAPPMFEFTPEASCTATWRQRGDSTVIEAETTLTTAFILHHGLSVKDCTLRVSRKGKRQLDLSGLVPDVRRVVGTGRHGQGWQEVMRVPMDSEGRGVLKLVRGDDGFVKISWRHSFSATAAVLPLQDEWEYRFELQYGRSAQVLATWNSSVELKIPSVQDLRTAKVKLHVTGLEQPLLVALTEKK